MCQVISSFDTLSLLKWLLGWRTPHNPNINHGPGGFWESVMALSTTVIRGFPLLLGANKSWAKWPSNHWGRTDCPPSVEVALDKQSFANLLAECKFIPIYGADSERPEERPLGLLQLHFAIG